jgi:DNA repair photolyase
MTKVGITENGDPSINDDWVKWALEKRQPTILITKNIKLLLSKYPSILTQPNIIIHATITGYGGSLFEPNVPRASEMIGCLQDAQQKDRIVIRIDPIIPIDLCVQQSLSVYNHCAALGFSRFRVSILDLYPHVLQRFAAHHEITYQLKQIYEWDLSHSLGEHKPYMVHAPLALRQSIINRFPNCEICAEPGIACTGCISRKDLQLMGITPEKRYTKNDQRPFCACLGIKKELLHIKDCRYNCIYCYQIKITDKAEKAIQSF